MDLVKKIGQLFFVGIEGKQLDLQSRHILRTISPGGIILFERNIESPSALFQLCQHLRAELPNIPFIGIDAEGGTVDRLRNISPRLAPAMALGATDNEIFSFRQGQLTGKLLFILGMNLNFAPVVDLASGSSANGIGTRSYGSFSPLVIKMGRGYIRGLSQQGIISVIKHFPGMGQSPADPHYQLPKIVKSEKKLWENDIRVFDALKESTNIIMVAHLLYPSLDKEILLPASLSFKVINGLLRKKMGYKNIVITDDLEMGAITQGFEVNEAALKSLQAGADMLLICHSYDKMLSAYNYLLQAVERGEISDVRVDSSVNRILNIKSQLEKQAQSFSLDEFNKVCQQMEELSQVLAENALTEIRRKKNSILSSNEEVTIFYPKPKINSSTERADIATILRREYGQFLPDLNLAPYDPDKPKLKKEEAAKQQTAIILSHNAHLFPNLPGFFKQITGEYEKVYFLSLNFPADLKIIKANAALALYTDSVPFLKTALLILLGRLKPRGKLPIDKKLLSSSSL